MAVTVHGHDPAALTADQRPDGDGHDPNVLLFEALRAAGSQLSTGQADALALAAWGIIERYCGRLVVARATTLLVEVTDTAELVDPAGWWTPRPSSVDTVETWTRSGGWADVTADVSPVDPLSRFRLEAGWWRLTTTAGKAPTAEMLEAWARVAAYLFDTDPAAGHRVSERSNVVRLCGAASLLGPYCVRGARPVEAGR
ncbi:MAG: hypothetical protein F4Z82_02840 [Caldilineaceae bacterium SB0668_bin_21]|nr:hypothetical protein [Caldilineaceae bacterium SB0668_bin_21]MXX24372.1 hypothetical protein [Caldilineaceae bacterium SB0668_bin_21]